MVMFSVQAWSQWGCSHLHCTIIMMRSTYCTKHTTYVFTHVNYIVLTLIIV